LFQSVSFAPESCDNKSEITMERVLIVVVVVAALLPTLCFGWRRGIFGE